jgi:hypothetical protein
MRPLFSTEPSAACCSPTYRIRVRSVRLPLASLVFVACAFGLDAAAQTKITFVAATAAHESAARAYRAIWASDGERILRAFQAETCLPFSEADVGAVVDDIVSHSGGPEHPMGLRASYGVDLKQSTLVHELGHRLLWQLPERLDDLDGHRTLYLVLDRVWAAVWGEEFAASRIADESSWAASYDYAGAWQWVRGLDLAERRRLWTQLLALNGFDAECRATR